MRKPLMTVIAKECQVHNPSISSTSGFFQILAEQIISQNGIVYGSALNSDMELKTVAIRNMDEMSSICGSKYVYGSFIDSFHDCARSLESGKSVLYVGLPCQIAALDSFLAKHCTYDPNLLLKVDLICHGAPPQSLFSAYISWLEEKVAGLVVDFTFRKKIGSWGEYVGECVYQNNGKYRTLRFLGETDPYYSAFLNGEIFRECCYACNFAKPERMGDITIGDAWGIEKLWPDFYDPDGVSLVLINSAIGLSFFKRHCKGKCTSLKVDFDEAATFNQNLLHPTTKPADYAQVKEGISIAIAENNPSYIFDTVLNRPRSFKQQILQHLPLRVALLYRSHQRSKAIAARRQTRS